MVLTINGEPREVTAATITALLAELGHEGTFFAVALNHEVVRRARWSTTTLGDGDAVEILTPHQGG